MVRTGSQQKTNRTDKYQIEHKVTYVILGRCHQVRKSSLRERYQIVKETKGQKLGLSTWEASP